MVRSNGWSPIHRTGRRRAVGRRLGERVGQAEAQAASAVLHARLQASYRSTRCSDTAELAVRGSVVTYAVHQLKIGLPLDDLSSHKT